MKIIVHSEPHAEDNAALQAWYSRSAAGVEAHREKLSKEGSGKFMDRIFIQYGHASVGDLGYTTVYFEGISMLAAKAIQDNPLYNGQECSSRYIDFSSQPFYTPPSSGLDQLAAFQSIYDRMREFYTSSLEPLKADLKLRYPRQEADKEAVYEKAIAAKAFDILRGFLPCGATTNVAWSGTLRNFKERLELMMHHPLPEVRYLATKAYEALYESYPHSFRSDYAAVGLGSYTLKETESLEVYAHLSQIENFYSDILVTSSYEDGADQEGDAVPDTIIEIEGYSLPDSSAHPRGYRPARHHFLRPRVTINGLIDFGSFRDLQRHRGGYCSMPVVDPFEGVHRWYLDQLPDALREEARALVKRVQMMDKLIMSMVEGNVGASEKQRIINQYFMPMGMVVPFTLDYDLSQAIYVAELRSSKTVHPTLRPIAQQLARTIEAHGGTVYYDASEDDWTVRRGAQDIVEVVDGA